MSLTECLLNRASAAQTGLREGTCGCQKTQIDAEYGQANPAQERAEPNSSPHVRSEHNPRLDPKQPFRARASGAAPRAVDWTPDVAQRCRGAGATTARGPGRDAVEVVATRECFIICQR